MRCDFSMGNTRMKIVAGAVLFSLASVAAASNFVGGGATLPAFGYVGASSSSASLGNPLVPTAGTLFGVYAANSGNTVTYCPTGSGAGKRILAGNAPTVEAANGLCLDTAPNVAGFRATSGAAITQAAFAGSDAPMSLAEVANYKTGHASLPEQFPAVAGAIAIAFNKSGVSSLSLSEAKICAVFSGQITTWDELTAGAATGPIHIVYRGDGSGTSFSFLNHLSAVCGLSSNVLAGKTAATLFKTNQTFATGVSFSNGVDPTYFSKYNAPVSQSGNGGVSDYIKANDGTLGYAEAAYSIPTPGKFASVVNTVAGGSAINPSLGFGTNAVKVQVQFSKAIADTVDTNGRPTLVALPTANATDCVAVVDPSDYANPATGYPILAVTYLLGNQAGNGSDAAAIRTLLGSPYSNAPNRGSVTKIGRIATGYAWLADTVANTVLDSTNATTGVQARINSCIN
jgi:ABC-type phosphate transport system substrate-binding protein